MSFFDDVMDLGGDILGGVGDLLGGAVEGIGDVLGGVGDIAGDFLGSDLGKLALIAGGAYLGLPSLFAAAPEGAMAAGLGEAAASTLPEAIAAGGAATMPETLAMASNFPNMAAIESGLGTAGYGASAAAEASGLFAPEAIGAGAGAGLGGAPVVDLAGTAVPGLNNPMGAADISFGQGLKDLYKAGGLTTGLNTMRLGSSLYDMYAKNKMAGAQQNHLNQLNNMYAPGTPEYNNMARAIARKDAAAGRNSQYGVRAQNLAGIIAGERAKLLGSAGYTNTMNSQLANRYGGLNSLFAQMGRQTGMTGGA